MGGEPEKGRYGTSHYAKAIPNIKSFLHVEADKSITKIFISVMKIFITSNMKKILSRRVNRQCMGGKPVKGRHGTSHYGMPKQYTKYQIIPSCRSWEICYESFHYGKHENILSRTVNRKWMGSNPEKGRHGTSHYAKAIYQISNHSFV